jgi:hypothetical protein
MSFIRALWIYIYIEKKVFYNIEGQLRGLQGLNQAKTCAQVFLLRGNASAARNLLSRCNAGASRRKIL